MEGEEYFPLGKGAYTVYKVTETKYSIVSGNETREYFLKEVVADSASDDFNNLVYRIERFSKDNEEDPWDLDSVWTARKSGNQFIKVENNIEFVKLVIPVKEGKEWNGNAFNSREKETYRMEMVHQPLLLNDIQFDSTLTQIQKMDSNVVAQDFRTEIYAKGVGLIYKKFIVTTNHQENGSIVFPIKIDNGIDLTQTIIEYGTE